MYNRYSGNTGRYVRVEEPEEAPRRPPEPPRQPAYTQGAAKPSGLPAPVNDLLSGLLGRLETADILLIAILLLLYLEKKDEDLLITLAALVFFSLG